VLIARGRIIADGSATEIKAQAGSRTIRATLPRVDVASLGALPGVLRADRHGDAVILSCSDTDTALGALLGKFPGVVRDIEVQGQSLEEAFVELTADDPGHDRTSAGQDYGDTATGEKRPDDERHSPPV